MAAGSPRAGKALSGTAAGAEKEGKAAVFSPWRIAFGVGGCGDKSRDLSVSPIRRRRHHVRTVIHTGGDVDVILFHVCAS